MIIYLLLSSSSAQPFTCTLLGGADALARKYIERRCAPNWQNDGDTGDDNYRVIKGWYYRGGRTLRKMAPRKLSENDLHLLTISHVIKFINQA